MCIKFFLNSTWTRRYNKTVYIGSRSHYVGVYLIWEPLALLCMYACRNQKESEARDLGTARRRIALKPATMSIIVSFW
jgi:hypothetical protein